MIGDAAERAVKLAKTRDVYFNIHTLRAKQVTHRSDPNRTQVRVQTNMVEAKCFFWDIDVDPNDPVKYDTQQAAADALRVFITTIGLPNPLIASSGGGLHVYWPLTHPIPSEEWREHATHLRQLALHYGLRIDLSRTTDSSSVLRVLGTFNHKNPLDPQPVELLRPGKETPNGVFVKTINEAVIVAGLTPKAAPQLSTTESTGNLDIPYDGPTPNMRAVFTACEQMARLARLKGNFSEPEWYRSVIGIGRFTEGGQRDVQKLSKGHPDYSEAATNAKIKQSEANQKAPSSCATVASVSGAGDTMCESCPFQGKVHGPIQAALFRDPAPAPVVQELIAGSVVDVTLPDAPAPFMRMKDGSGIAYLAKNADGEETNVKIFDYDLYPIRRLANSTAGIEQQVWHVTLPRGEAKDFTLDAEMLYDLRKFIAAVANNGLYPHKSHLPLLQEYMTAYIAQLQKLADADAQCNHLGWIDDQSAFIMPDKILYLDGTSRSAQLSVGAQRASAAVSKGGTLEKQVELMQFYNKPAYIPNQFFILASLAAPIFYATGHHGVIVNASGDAGASKSTTLYTGSSLWGQPEMYPINGTNNGATVRGRNERVQVLANLPVCVDEITHMPIHDAVDLAMSITQPGHRIRLQTDGVERATTGSYKATIMLTTANSSLHSKLSMDNAAGTAGSMRVFEMIFVAGRTHNKFEADDFLFDLKQNYGHIGERFIVEVLKRRDWIKARIRAVMKDIDQACGIQSSERFWSATVAAVLVAGELAFELGLLPYDVAAIREWVITHQIPMMRGVVKQEYSDPLSIVADYLEAINGNIIMVHKPHGGNISNSSGPRSGALLAHYDVDQKLLFVLKKAFRDHCAKTGANATKVIDDLHVPRGGSAIIPQTHTKRVLGAGTEFAKVQSWCFAINMDHPDVTGAVNLHVVPGGGGSVSPLSATS